MENILGDIDWNKIHQIPIKACRTPKLRELQYKITNNYLNTNKQLKIYGIRRVEFVISVTKILNQSYTSSGNVQQSKLYGYNLMSGGKIVLEQL